MIERTETPRGKTATLKWALDRLPLNESDAVVVFDADNLVNPDFLTRINEYLAARPEAAALQERLEVKNPHDSWVTRISALTFWYANRFWQHPRDLLGISVNLGGTGQVIRASALRELKLDWTSLTDDLELTAAIVSTGGRIRYAYDAVTYDEKPTTGASSRAQRARWIRGHYGVLRRYGWRLVRDAVLCRSLSRLDLFMHLLIPGRAAMSYMTMFGGLILVAAATVLAPG